MFPYDTTGAPRTSLNEPDLKVPIPIKYIDVMRRTETKLDSEHEKQIIDHWTNDRGDPLGTP